MSKKFTLIKKIAKHGNQAIIVIPKMLENILRPGEIVQLHIEVLNDIN